jgi:hypothetical protein
MSRAATTTSWAELGKTRRRGMASDVLFKHARSKREVSIESAAGRIDREEEANAVGDERLERGRREGERWVTFKLIGAGLESFIIAALALIGVQRNIRLSPENGGSSR